MAADEEARTDRMKIAIGCHHYLLGEGLSVILADESTVQVIGVFTEGVDFHEIRKAAPDLLVLDYPVFQEMEEILKSDNHQRVLLLTGSNFPYAAKEHIRNLIDQGIVGIVPHFTPSPLFRKAVTAIAKGELWFDRRTMADLALQNSNSRKRDIRLTKSEREVTSLLCQGFRNKEVAQRMDITEQTVKSHCNRIFKKVGVTDRLQLVIEIHRHFPELAAAGKEPS